MARVELNNVLREFSAQQVHPPFLFSKKTPPDFIQFIPPVVHFTTEIATRIQSRSGHEKGYQTGRERRLDLSISVQEYFFLVF